MQDGVAAFSEGCLSAEVSNDVHQPIPEIVNSHPLRHPLQQAQWVDVPPNVVH